MTDPARAARTSFEQTMRLLWEPGARPARGPKPRLSREAIVAAAVELADQSGLRETSMRAVARALGVGTMSLYRYVPSKDALVDLMFDSVLSRQPKAADLPGDWRAKLEAVARIDLALYLRHPWVLEVSSSRPPLGPGTLDTYESVLRAVVDSGLPQRELNAAVTALSAYVRGAAQTELTRMRTVRDSGLTDEQWWSDRGQFWERWFDPERYPTITAIYASGAYDDPPDEFEFGLQRLLDGIAAHIAAAR
jgi:AcrR family transcriptional regulator